MLKQDSKKYSGYRQAGIRLNEEILPSIQPHRSEKVSRTLYAVHMFDKAHLVTLVEEKLIPRKDGIAMLKALRDMEAKGMEKVRMEAQGGMHSGEQYLIRTLGEEVGGRVHLARSTPDFQGVCGRIGRRDALLDVMDRVNQFRRVLIEVAKKNLDTIMPAYSHGRHAQPTTYGHVILGWVSSHERDFARLQAIYDKTNESPAGSAIVSGAGFAVNRHRVSDLLGFDRPIKNTFDATMHYDILLECHAAVTILHASLLKWSEDLMLYTTNEFDMFDVPDRFCGTSSIMMQKKNMYASEEIKGSGAEAIGNLMTAFMIEKDSTSIPILDRNYSLTGLYRSLDTAVRDLDWLILMMPHVKPKKAHMEKRAGDFWGQATDVAAALVREKGLNWRSAHQIVGILVRFSTERGIAPRDTTTELLDEAAIAYFEKPVNLLPEALRDALDPRKFIELRTIYGGAAPEEAKRRIPEYKDNLKRDEAWISKSRKQIAGAAKKLEAAIDTLLQKG